MTEPTAEPAHGLGPLVETYVTGRQARGEIGVRTATHLRTRLNSLARSSGQRPLDRHVIEAWQEQTFGPLSPASRRSYLSSVKVFCRWLVAEGHLPVDPTAGLPRVRQPRRVPRALPAAAVAKVFVTAGLDVRMRAVLWLMVGMGLRCAEVAGLAVADYDPDAGTLFVRGKFGNERLLPVPEEVAAAVDFYLRVGGWETGPLIRGMYGRSALDPQSLSALVSKTFAAAGIKAGPYDGRSAHALRHTCASDVLDACHDLRVVKELLGHLHLSSTEIYLRGAGLDQIREAMGGRSYRAAV